MAKLNTAQHTSLAVGLRSLSTTCAAIEDLLAGKGATELVRLEDDLTNAERLALTIRLDELRGQIAELAARWQVTPQPVSVRRQIVARLSSEWAMLMDLRPHTLRRYGKVNEAAAAALEPALNRLITAVEDLMAVGSGRPPNPRTVEATEEKPK